MCEHAYLEKDFRQVITLGIQWIHALQVLSYYTAVQQDYCFSNEIAVRTQTLQTYHHLSENSTCFLEWFNVHMELVYLSSIRGASLSLFVQQAEQFLSETVVVSEEQSQVLFP